jgi:ribulose-phosphate 3-epimerase
MVAISASLLAADFANMAENVQSAQIAGSDRFHLDFMDGHYVPNLALTPTHLTDLRAHTNLPLDVHLEISNPDQILAAFPKMDADEITVQIDTSTNLSKTFSAIGAQKARIGLGINPDTSLDLIYPHLTAIDTLIVLGVIPGFGGQTMSPDTAERVNVAKIMRQRANAKFNICVDGGVKIDNAKELIQAGADILVIGTGLFQSRDMKSMISNIKSFDS